MDEPQEGRPFWIDTVRVEPATGLLWRDGAPNRVRPQVMDLLVALAQRPGEVLSKANLLDRVWATRFVSESALTTAIAELREALGDDSRDPRFVQTVPKRGYRLVAAVRADEAPEPSPDQGIAEPDPLPLEHAPVAVEGPPLPRASHGWGRPVIWYVALASILVAIGLANSRGNDAVSGSPKNVRPVSLGPGERWPANDISTGALSPDGSRLAYVVEADEGRRLMLRELHAVHAVPVEGTTGAASPFFSPDGKWLGFFQNGALKRVRVDGGSIESVATALISFGATWRDNGDLIYAPSVRSGLILLPAGGVTPRQVTTPNSAAGDSSHRWPDAIPGTPFVVYSAFGKGLRVRAVNLDSGEDHVVVEQSSLARFAAPDRLLFARGSKLVAAPFDPLKARITGPETEVMPDVEYGANSGLAQFTVSATGGLAFRSRPMKVERELVLVDRTGQVSPLPSTPQPYIHPRVSPDGKRVAVWVEDDTTGAADVWTYELATRALKRQTFTGASFRPVWAPDSQRLALDARPSGSANVFLMSLSQPELLEPLVRRDRLQSVEDWSPDGRTVVISQNEPDTGNDLLLVDVATRRVRPLANGSAVESGAAISPDGHWIAFVSVHAEETGIYIAPADPARAARIRVAGHGREVRWSRDGRELFFRSGGAMFAVPIAVVESELQVGSPSTLFRGTFEERPATRANYDVMSDGRFLMLQRKGPVSEEIVLSFDWRERLDRHSQPR